MDIFDFFLCVMCHAALPDGKPLVILKVQYILTIAIVSLFLYAWGMSSESSAALDWMYEKMNHLYHHTFVPAGP